MNNDIKIFLERNYIVKKFLTILILSTLILCVCNFEQDVENKNDRNASTKTTGNEQRKESHKR